MKKNFEVHNVRASKACRKLACDYVVPKEENSSLRPNAYCHKHYLQRAAGLDAKGLKKVVHLETSMFADTLSSPPIAPIYFLLILFAGMSANLEAACCS